MTIAAVCPGCRVSYPVDDRHAGMSARCRRCNGVFTIADGPGEPSSGAPQDSTPGSASRHAGFDGGARPAADLYDSSGCLLLGEPRAKPAANAARRRPAQGPTASVLAAIAPAQADGQGLTPEQIRVALSGKIEPVRSTALYKLWIGVVAAVMVLLPLIYVSIIVLLVAGLIQHARYKVTVFEKFGRGGNAVKAAVAVYIGPLVIGSVVVLFMLKPFFARPARRAKQRVLDRNAEPRLHALVEQICASVGSPRPTRIEVNCDVNASARREGPLLGIFGSRLVLTIGMPLAAGLTLKQFTGVLAHEFGHFSQGAGMRLCAIIRTVNMWFARVVYERDAWDQRLAAMASFNQASVQILGGLTRMAVWLTRRVLWVLMWAGHLVSSFLSRQMEFDADRYEARMVGGSVFAETSRRLRVMSIAQNGAYHDLGTSWKEGRLPDDFSKLVIANVHQLPSEMLTSMHADEEKAVTGLFESHPCDRDRIARAQIEAPAEGIFRLEGPASAVFSDIDELSRSVSLDYYRSIVDAGIQSDQLFSVVDLIESQAFDQEGHAAARRFLLDAVNLLTLRVNLPAGAAGIASSGPVSGEALAEARNDLVAARSRYLEASKQADEVFNRLHRIEFAIAAQRAGHKADLSELGLSSPKPDQVASAREAVVREADGLDQEFAPFGTAASRRLELAVAALLDDARASQIPDGPARRDEALALLPCLARLSGEYCRSVRAVLCARSVLIDLAGALQSAKDSQKKSLGEAFEKSCGKLAKALADFQANLGDDIEYPFEHADRTMTLGKFMIAGELPGSDNPGGLLEAVDAAVNRVLGLYYRILGRLAHTAEAVEESFGLSPIVIEETQQASA